ncbi:MAG: hypothetical protein VYA71_06855 [Pseudomonadota bacterium]|nr:hypothetical protein [Pseudomonadota bacterium]
MTAPEVFRDRAELAVLALVFLASAVLRLDQTVNNDIAWYLYAAGTLLDGGVPYDDIFFEVNPPLMLYLTVPAVAAARLTGLFVVHAYFLYVFAVVALSLALTWRLVDDYGAPRKGFLAVAVFVLVILPAADFGQREPMMVTLAMPYFALAILRASGHDCPTAMAILIGGLAALGFAIKPHFLLVPVLLELYRLTYSRDLGAMFRAETLALAAGVAFYLSSILVFTPDYVSRVVPFALEVYNAAYRNTLGFVMNRPEAWLLPAVLVTHGLTRRRQRFAIAGDVFLVASVGFFIAYLAQMKGWNYHIHPTRSMLAMALGLMVTGALLDSRETITRPRFPLALTLTAIAVLAGLSLRPLVLSGYHNEHLDRLLPIVREHAGGKAIYFISSNTWTGFPLVTYAEVEWSSRAASLWLLPGYARAREAGEMSPGLRDIERYTIDTVVADLTAKPPAVILLDERRDKPWYGGIDFDFIAFFSTDPRFVEIWRNYEPIAVVEEFHIYRRRNDGAAAP